jgi:hypothetical protein
MCSCMDTRSRPRRSLLSRQGRTTARSRAGSACPVRPSAIGGTRRMSPRRDLPARDAGGRPARWPSPSRITQSSSACISATAISSVPGGATACASSSTPGRGNHRGRPGLARALLSGARGRSISHWEGHRHDSQCLLHTPGVSLPPARPGCEARTRHRARGLADGHRRALTVDLPPWPDPVRRVRVRQPHRAIRVRLLRGQQSLGADPPALHGRVRPRRCVVQAVSPICADLPARERRIDAGECRWKGVTGR